MVQELHPGSSGGPLFDKDGNINRIKHISGYCSRINIAVSADHIKELLNK